jgi:hypothetical protein
MEGGGRHGRISIETRRSGKEIERQPRGAEMASMNKRYEHDLGADALQSAEEADPIAAWRLDELDQSADLDNLRWAVGRTDD